VTRPIYRETILQKHVRIFVRDAVDGPHDFSSADSAKKSTPWARGREAARGIRKGEPDCRLKVPTLPAIHCELKYPPNKVVDGDDQHKRGLELIAVGDLWFWTDSVTGYMEGLARFGVPLRLNASFQAQHHDAAVASCIARAEAKRGLPVKRKASRPRAEKPTPAAIKRVNAVRERVRF